jgi:hypothetical protein
LDRGWFIRKIAEDWDERLAHMTPNERMEIRYRNALYDIYGLVSGYAVAGSNYKQEYRHALERAEKVLDYIELRRNRRSASASSTQEKQ